jgi:peptide/nickel transport system permease protein
MDFGTLFGGAVLTETLFGIPGIGQKLVTSVRTEDLPVVLGVTLAMGCFVVLANAVADVLYALADRRVVLA